MVENLRSTITLDEGRNAFSILVGEREREEIDWNEAETRFHFIDSLLTTCLGWPKSIIAVENYHDGEYADYLLGHPPSVIWEAKREGKYFDLPANMSRRLTQSLSSIMAVSEEAKKAIRQVQNYCATRGVKFAVICNGSQLIAFLAIRIGDAPLDGKALVFRDQNHMMAQFGVLWQNLSQEGIGERRLYRLLTSGSNVSLPPKPSSFLVRFPTVRYQSNTQATLRSIAELIIEDIPEHEDIEENFYRVCYCETGALSRDSLLSKDLLMARYAALFPDDEEHPKMEPVSSRQRPLEITPEIITEAVARRPIILLGDVGVGKTSFIKQLMLLKASEEFSNSLNIYIDLGSKAALETDLKKFVVNEIERQLMLKYNVDTEESNFVRGVYDLEVKKFRKSIRGQAFKNDRDKYEEQVLEMLIRHLDEKPTHLRRSIEHISKARKRQVIIILDNSDQRPSDIQQAAFIVAQEFASDWNAMVFISVRPQTFFQSKRAGALSAYPHRVFTIAPPRPELVIEKRLKFALNVTEGKIEPNKMRGISIDLEGLSLFLKALLVSMEQNPEIRGILANITGGNIRAVIEFVVKFIGSPNVDVEKIIRIMREDGRYLIPIHEFSKAAILGDFSHYNPDSSMAMNLFDLQYPDEREHFLALMILGFLQWSESPKDKDGFTTADDVISEMQGWGFLQRQTEGKLRRLTNRRLIESSERVTFEEDESLDLIGDIPFAFRLTSVGVYHIKNWAGIFAYLDAMVFDTPIFTQDAFEDIRGQLDGFSIGTRLQRTKRFRDYLTGVWNSSNLSPSYFNWSATVARGNDNFNRVEGAVSKMQNKP